MLTIKTVKSYFFNDSGKFLVTWIMVKKNPGNIARVYSGWTVFDDYEKSGIPLCIGPGAGRYTIGKVFWGKKSKKNFSLVRCFLWCFLGKKKKCILCTFFLNIRPLGPIFQKKPLIFMRFSHEILMKFFFALGFFSSFFRIFSAFGFVFIKKNGNRVIGRARNRIIGRDQEVNN